MMLMSAALLGPEDVVIGFCHSERSTAVIDAIQLARGNGDRTIVVTNYNASPLAEIADIVPCSTATAPRSWAKMLPPALPNSIFWTRCCGRRVARLRSRPCPKGDILCFRAGPNHPLGDHRRTTGPQDWPGYCRYPGRQPAAHEREHGYWLACHPAGGGTRVQRLLLSGFTNTCADEAQLGKPTMPGDGSGANLNVPVNLNVRVEARDEADILGVVPADSCVVTDICTQTSNGVWCRACFGEELGWLKKMALRQERWPSAHPPHPDRAHKPARRSEPRRISPEIKPRLS